MPLKLFVAFSLISSFRLLLCSTPTPVKTVEEPIDKAWWDGLSEEWKTILRINQYFYQHKVDVFKIQEEYMNRLNKPGDDPISERNTSLRNLNEKREFLLSYEDMYARVRKKFSGEANDKIDLNSLPLLETIYMVSGPGDLQPLRKFPNLKVLIINFCGIGSGKQSLNLEPLQQLKQLTHLYCSSPFLQTIEPIKDLNNLLVLNCYNSSVVSLEPLKNLTKLESLSIGSKATNISAITRLTNLEELHVSGCKQIPDLSPLKKLKRLSIVENELALVDRNFQIRDLSFLKNCSSLEYLDFELTSYRGTLDALRNLTQLKAVTLPRVSSIDMEVFRKNRNNCTIINANEFE